jgi:hypothetical protein
VRDRDNALLQCASLDVTTVVPELEAARLFRGKGGELVRAAACTLTQCVSDTGAPMTLNAKLVAAHLGGKRDSDKTATKRHKEFLDDCLRNNTMAIQEVAASALRALCAA